MNLKPLPKYFQPNATLVFFSKFKGAQLFYVCVRVYCTCVLCVQSVLCVRSRFLVIREKMMKKKIQGRRGCEDIRGLALTQRGLHGNLMWQVMQGESLWARFAKAKWFTIDGLRIPNLWR